MKNKMIALLCMSFMSGMIFSMDTVIQGMPIFSSSSSDVDSSLDLNLPIEGYYGQQLSHCIELNNENSLNKCLQEIDKLDCRQEIVNFRDENGDTLAHKSVESNFSARLLYMLASRGCSFLQKNAQGLTPLHLAVECTKYDVGALLICLEPQLVMEQDRNGKTPLHYAFDHKNVEMIECLMNGGGFEQALVTDKRKTTPFCYFLDGLIKNDSEESWKLDEFVVKAFVKNITNLEQVIEIQNLVRDIRAIMPTKDQQKKVSTYIALAVNTRVTRSVAKIKTAQKSSRKSAIVTNQSKLLNENKWFEQLDEVKALRSSGDSSQQTTKKPRLSQ